MRSKTANNTLCTIAVFVKPNAKHARIVQVAQHQYDVALNAPQRDGKANKKLVEVLAEYFCVAPSAVRIISGFASRIKRVQIIGKSQ